MPSHGAAVVTTPDVTVTIVLYRSEAVVGGAIESILPSLQNETAELVAVDNASGDRSAAKVKAGHPQARIVRSDRNRGFAGGANLAWPAARGRYWLLLNPDARLSSGGIETLVRWMNSHPDMAIASPFLADPAGNDVRAPGRPLPSAGLVLLELLRLHRLLPRALRSRIFQGPYWIGGDQLECGWVPGTAMIIRREAVEQAGLLDERFFLYGEDIEWCWRMRRAGWKVGACASVIAEHEEFHASSQRYGEAETLRRIASTETEVVRRGRGHFGAAAYAALTTISLGLESVHPGRTADARSNAKAWRRAWVSAVQQLLRTGGGPARKGGR